MSSQGDLEGGESARLRVVARRSMIPPVVAFIGEVGEQLGIPKTERDQLCIAVEESCLNVVEHAFEPGETGSYDVVVEWRPGKLVVAVEDRGLPFDPTRVLCAEAAPSENEEDSAGSNLGFLLMRAFADEVAILNRGKEGKRVELIKYLSGTKADELLGPAAGESSVAEIAPDVPVSFRRLRPDREDAVALSRCIYRSYGYSYVGEYLYYPEKIQESIASGRMISCVAVTPDDEIVGHLALSLEQPGAAVGESGQAVVDPRIRGRNLFRAMKEYLATEALKAGMIGFYSESVANHPYTQRGNLFLGARETGLLLSFIPTSIFFKKIDRAGDAGEGEPARVRRPAVLFYMRIGEEPEREIHCPIRHREMVERIYLENRLRRVMIMGEGGEPGERSEIDLRVVPGLSEAIITVGRAGSDLQPLVRHRMQELFHNRIEVIHVDLPLGDPSTPDACEQLEGLGFFFAGIVPELHEGDVLRLQYTNTTDSRPEDICLVSDFAKELHRYVLAEKKRVDEL